MPKLKLLIDKLQQTYFGLILAFACLVSLLQVSIAQAADKPNIILITVDDLGWTDTGVYGSSWYQTPNIDHLAAEGMRFTDAYAAGAICSPTRSALMTGRYPARTGITDWIRAEYQGGKIPADGKNPTGYESNPKKAFSTPVNPLFLESEEVTFAEVLKAAGYKTGHIGKWHLGPEPWDPAHQGFEENIGGGDLGEPPSYFDPYFRAENPDWQEPQLLGIPHMPSRRIGEYLTDREADEAVAFIRRHKDKPFLLNLSHYAVHTPVQGKPDIVKKYEANPSETGHKNADYAAMIESVDESLGQILDELEAQGISDNTIIIFTSDNGGLSWKTSNAPLRGGKGNPYEGGIRIPLIVRWPGLVAPGSVSSEPVNSIDWLPTFADFAGVPLPGDHEIDGTTIVPLLKGQNLNREALYWHFPHYRGKQAPFSIIREGDWKLIYYYGMPAELYNLENDLSEETDLAESMPEKVAELQRKLEQALADQNAKLPQPNNPDAT